MIRQCLLWNMPRPMSLREQAWLGVRLRLHNRIVSAAIDNDNRLVIHYQGTAPLAWIQREIRRFSANTVPVKKAITLAEGPNFTDYRRDALLATAGLVGMQVLRWTNPGLYNSLQLARSVFVLFVARSFFFQGIKGMVQERRPNADLLTATAVSASVLAGKPESSLSLLALSNVSEMMTTYTAEKARKHISSMLRMDQQFAWKLDENHQEIRVAVESLLPGDCIGVHLGEKICVDGQVIAGNASVDQSSITGEYIPALKKHGDAVYAGTVLKNGYIEVAVEKVGDSTAVARIINMVEEAQSRRAPVQSFADRMSSMLVPISFLAAALVYGATRNWQRVLNMLFIDFSCGLKLSTATAISAAIGKAASRGALIKGGNFIETMANVDTVVLDKTGTITVGTPQVTNVEPVEGVTVQEIIVLAAAIELHSSHPLASAILEFAEEQGWEIPQHTWTEPIIARGMKGFVPDTEHARGGEILVGSARFLQEEGVALDLLPAEASMASALNVVYAARNQTCLGRLTVADPVRANLKKCINQLRRRGVDEVIMLTGDTERVAAHVAGQLDLDAYYADVLPDEKAALVAKLQRRSPVLMVGDGINDAPALAFADVGVAMGGKRTDIAVESAAMTINSEDPLVLSEVVALSKDTMAIVRQNFTATIAINTIAMLLGAMGRTTPMVSAVIHNAATVGVVMNSARILMRGRVLW